MGREEGFTLLELMVVALVTTILLTIGSVALRHYWLVRALSGAQDQVATQLRGAQQQSMSESHPWVFGARFQKGSSSWGVVRYNVTTGACSVVSSLSFDGNVVIVDDAQTDFPDVTGATTACRNATPGASANHEVVFFYARGNSSASSTVGSVKLVQPTINRTERVTVSPITGRVTKL